MAPQLKQLVRNFVVNFLLVIYLIYVLTELCIFRNYLYRRPLLYSSKIGPFKC